VQDLVHPLIDLGFVGENTALHRTIHPMDGEPKLCFPAPAGPLGALEVRRNLFPRLEEILVRHQIEPWRIVESRAIWIVDHMGAADLSVIVLLDWRCAQSYRDSAMESCGRVRELAKRRG
jgi:hypothetical protein